MRLCPVLYIVKSTSGFLNLGAVDIVEEIVFFVVVVVGAALSIVEGLAASLASAYWMPVSPLTSNPSPIVTTTDVSIIDKCGAGGEIASC